MPRVHIDPWGSSQYQDYARLRSEFGIEPFGAEDWQAFDAPHMLLKRGVVFGHRDFQRIRDAVSRKEPWSVMTGLMPSGLMHLGHKMVIEQCIAHQQHGADLHIAVADFEAVAARNLSIEKAQELAIDQYVRNYLALGLDPNSAEVYFQTKRHRVKDLADRFALKVKWSQMQQMYGFGDKTTIAHVNAPLVQAADILHVQRPDLGGPRPVLVPVGVDQDPHIRLARDIAQSWRTFNVYHADKAEGPKAKAGWAIAIRGDEDPKRWLDMAEAVLEDQGMGTRMDRVRNDAYRHLYLGDNMSMKDVRDLDLALAQKEAKKGGLAFIRPSATFHRFMTGFTGEKMSSSKPESSAFLTEEPKVASKKVLASVTGGRGSAEEQRQKGGEADKCPVYELFLYHLAKDDNHLQQVYDECVGGERLCGGCKGEAAELLLGFLKEHQEKRDQTEHLVKEIVSVD